MFTKAPSLVCLLALGLFPAAASAQNDKIFQSGQDKPLTVEIVEETLSDIAFKQGPATSRLPWDKISRIDYGTDNGAFQRAEENIMKGDAATAITALEGLKPAREIFAPRRLYWLGRAFETQGKFKEAEDKYNELVSKYEKSVYTKRAIRSLAEVQIKNKNFGGAVATADKGISIANNVKSPAVALEFRFLKATILEAQDKLVEAEGEYKAVAGAPDSGRSGKLAECGIARMAAKKGDVERVKSAMEPILKGSDPTLLAAAYAAMGDALLTKGTTEPNAERIREAAIENYLRVVVQCPPLSSDSQDDLERAMYGYAKAAKKLSELEAKQKDVAEFWKKESQQYVREFGERFPNSRFAKLVQELK
jgi:tetratricopeptide (TPR) repeat protein